VMTVGLNTGSSATKLQNDSSYEGRC